MHIPEIIQGGMGVGVSGWRLARAVARTGQLGVVSGTALDVVLARKLQLGDPSGDLRRALEQFPVPGVAERVTARWFIPGGRAPDAPYRRTPMPALRPSQASVELTVVANFVEVWLARQGHDGLVGVNYLEKIQLPTLPALYGALLAGVSVVLMGAGIPGAIPGLLDDLCDGRATRLPIRVEGAARDEFESRFDPAELWAGTAPRLARPRFLPIVSSHTLAARLRRSCGDGIDGFVVEAPSAGGHNAPPRARRDAGEHGEPVYGARDRADLDSMQRLGRPYWLAGGQATHEALAAARALGAAGIQVGTAFAFCRESGMESTWRHRALRAARAGTLRVRTDPLASPTGFPFKVLELAGSRGDPKRPPAPRQRCDLGYLRHAVRDDRGRASWRCPAEPVADYARKGGDPTDAEGRVCVCNGLVATIGLGRRTLDGTPEPPLFTCGDDLDAITRFLPAGATDYGAADVIEGLLGRSPLEAGGRPSGTV